MFRQGNSCLIETYFPCRFARQFGYDQLYIGNPNLRLSSSGTLFEGARAWYYFVAGCTGVKFSLPRKVPNLQVTLGFSSWYALASGRPGYNINCTYLREIKAKFESKRDSTNTRLPGVGDFVDSLSFPSDLNNLEEHGFEEERESITHPQIISRKRPHPHSTEIEPSVLKRSHHIPEFIREAEAVHQGANLLEAAFASVAVSEEAEVSLFRLPRDRRTTGSAMTSGGEPLQVNLETGEQHEAEAIEQETAPDATDVFNGQDDIVPEPQAASGTALGLEGETPALQEQLVSRQEEVPPASPTVLMPTTREPEPSPTTRLAPRSASQQSLDGQTPRT